MDQTATAVIGAGPHGLAAAAHLRRSGQDVHVFGDPMSFWRRMPEGMLLRSNWTATCIAEFEGPLSLDSYCAEVGTTFTTPVPLQTFVEYGDWVQAKVAPDVDRRNVVLVQQAPDGFVLHLDDGATVLAHRLVVAAGIAAFVNRPGWSTQVPSTLSSHTSDHRDLSLFAGKRVLVVGGGQSALESAALMSEAGADVEVVVRANRLNWLHGGKYHRKLGNLAPLVYAPTDVGPMGISRVVAVPGLFRRLPRAVQEPMAARAIRPAGAAWLQPRLAAVRIGIGRSVVAARPEGDQVHVQLDDGTDRRVDHVMSGTGYRVDISRYPFLDPSLVRQVETVDGYPLLRRGMESSVPRLHFLGAPAARSFGPIMRFVAGGWFGAESLTRAVSGRASSTATGQRAPLASLGDQA